MKMAPNLTLRKATPEDALEMQAIHNAASHNPALRARCFPESDPTSASGHLEWVKRQLPLEQGEGMFSWSQSTTPVVPS